MIVGLKTSCLPHKNISNFLTKEELKPVVKIWRQKEENCRDTDEDKY
jgi:hypothetical protein